MKGIPKIIGTKDDIKLLVHLATTGQLEKEPLREKIQDLLSDKTIWQFKAVVSASNPIENEKIMEHSPLGGGGTPELHCFERVINPLPQYLRMGVTEAEINSYLLQLQ